jgi:outer membrane lipoprotein SlyB
MGDTYTFVNVMIFQALLVTPVTFNDSIKNDTGSTGAFVGGRSGARVGAREGLRVGAFVGRRVGTVVGRSVGAVVEGT